MIGNVSNSASLGEVFRSLASFDFSGGANSLANQAAPSSDGFRGSSLQRVDTSTPSSPRVDVPDSIVQQIQALEKINNIGALRSVAITAFNTLNSSIKRVHQGQ